MKTKILALTLFFFFGTLFAGSAELPKTVPSEAEGQAVQAIEEMDYDALLALWEEYGPEWFSRQPPTREEFEQMLQDRMFLPGEDLSADMTTAEEKEEEDFVFQTSWGFEWPPEKGKPLIISGPPIPDLDLPPGYEGWQPRHKAGVKDKRQDIRRAAKDIAISPPEGFEVPEDPMERALAMIERSTSITPAAAEHQDKNEMIEEAEGLMEEAKALKEKFQELKKAAEQPG